MGVMTRHEIDPATLAPGGVYKLVNACVVPRAIAWVSSRSADGVDNLAPHSYFTVVSVDPPMIAFTSVGWKDSAANIDATGEFVVNMAAGGFEDDINATSTDFPAGISEFDAVGIEREPSRRVIPPRVAQSPVALECRKVDITPIGNCHLVIGEVLHVAIDEATSEPDPVTQRHPRPDAIHPLARLGRNEWAHFGTTFDLKRVPYRKWLEKQSSRGE